MSHLLPLIWMQWLDTAQGRRDRQGSVAVSDNGKICYRANGDHSSPPDPKLLAVGLRFFAEQNGQVPPAVLMQLADMFDPPKGYKGTTAKLSRPRGGRRQKHDWIAIGRYAHELIEPNSKLDAAIFQTAQKFSCGERTVRRYLELYRTGIQSRD